MQRFLFEFETSKCITYSRSNCEFFSEIIILISVVIQIAVQNDTKCQIKAMSTFVKLFFFFKLKVDIFFNLQNQLLHATVLNFRNVKKIVLCCSKRIFSIIFVIYIFFSQVSFFFLFFFFTRDIPKHGLFNIHDTLQKSKSK